MSAPRIDRPQPGFYKTRLVRGGPWVAGRIYEIPPLDPDTGELLDRPVMLAGEIGGAEVQIDEAWLKLMGNPIGEAEYRYLSSVAQWAGAYDPNSPEANPRSAVDLRQMAAILPPGVAP